MTALLPKLHLEVREVSGLGACHSTSSSVRELGRNLDGTDSGNLNRSDRGSARCAGGSRCHYRSNSSDRQAMQADVAQVWREDQRLADILGHRAKEHATTGGCAACTDDGDCSCHGLAGRCYTGYLVHTWCEAARFDVTGDCKGAIASGCQR